MRSILNVIMVTIMCILISSCASRQIKPIKSLTPISMDTDAYTSIVAARDYLHENAELSGQEKVTSEYIRKYLEKIGMEVRYGVGGYGVIGIIHGDKRGKKIAWRADIDANPVYPTSDDDEMDDVNKAIHSCGHDVHTAIGLGIADVLWEHRDYLGGTVYLIFQPSEENYLGAKAMINDGLFDMIDPNEIYAAHISPMPVGMIAAKANLPFADYKQINLSFKNVKDKEALYEYVKNTVSSLQNVPPDGDFWKFESLMRPDIGLGSPTTIFKDYITVEKSIDITDYDAESITISGYISASNESLMQSIPDLLLGQLATSPYADHVDKVEFYSEKFVYSTQRRNVNNDERLTSESLATLSDLDDETIMPLELYGVMPDGRGDDFAYFQERVPGVYYLIGGSDFQKGVIAMPHAPNFQVDEKVLKVGIEAFSTLIIKRSSAGAQQ